ncbi:DinB family protein [Cytophagaceae bacterium YF14B1]|uniref:DinB family protein n=1 Tax=Xanthocytophaga flava TaxID=3048013 RepID=A0AAE3QTY9_9BACT|nr:DinB family protein [Xanthocytophaga flavus]MDJ1483328.1 DinB family protein [Xanthocytophaga flavus]
MRHVSKDQLLDSLEEQVEQHLRQCVEQFQNLSETILLAPAANGGWSIAQCLEHLNSYGKYYLPQIQRGLITAQTKPNAETFRSTWLGSYFTRLMNPQTGKGKYKAFKGHIPDQNLNPYVVVAEFIQQQETLLSYIRQARHVDLNGIRIPISILHWIRLKLGDVLQFLIAHNERHIMQAQRNISISASIVNSEHA